MIITISILVGLGFLIFGAAVWMADRRIDSLEDRFTQHDASNDKLFHAIADAVGAHHEAISLHSDCLKHLMDSAHRHSATPSTNGCCPKDRGNA